MKKILLYALLFVTVSGFSQFALEHTYPTGLTKKISLEYSGDKYMVFDNITNTLFFYNPDHTFWKSIALDVPVGATLTSYDQVSESLINPDDKLEVAYSYNYSVGGEPAYITKIISEDATIYLALSNTPSVILSAIDGLGAKLIAKHFMDFESDVYSLPFPTLEHTYSQGQVTRIFLENSGEKYYLYDRQNNLLRLFNADHSVWKSISTPLLDNSLFYSIDVVSETALNPDSLVEVAYTCNSITDAGFVFEGKIVNENGVELVSVPDVNQMYLSKIDGLSDKLMVVGTSGTMPFTKVYDLPGFNLAHTYPTVETRVKLELSGEKYFSKFANSNAVTVYNADHSLWKTVDLPVNVPYNVFTINAISETRFTAGTSLGVAYSSQYVLGDIAYFYESAVADELGNVLLNVPDASNLYLTQTNGSDKLIANRFGDNPFGHGVGGQVYSIIPLLKADVFKANSTAVYPNPANSKVFVSSQNPIKIASLFDAGGVLVRNLNSDNLSEIETSNLRDGIYFLRLFDSKNYSIHKIIVSH